MRALLLLYKEFLHSQLWRGIQNIEKHPLLRSTNEDDCAIFNGGPCHKYISNDAKYYFPEMSVEASTLYNPLIRARYKLEVLFHLHQPEALTPITCITERTPDNNVRICPERVCRNFLQ